MLDSKPIHYYDLSHGIEFAPFNHRYVWHFDKYNFEILQRTGHWGEEKPFLDFEVYWRGDEVRDVEYQREVYIITDEGDTIKVKRKYNYADSLLTH